jgi:hypothetical protein
VHQDDQFSRLEQPWAVLVEEELHDVSAKTLPLQPPG